MVELVDTRDLGSRALGRAGSTPVPGTSRQRIMFLHFLFCRGE